MPTSLNTFTNKFLNTYSATECLELLQDFDAVTNAGRSINLSALASHENTALNDLAEAIAKHRDQLDVAEQAVFMGELRSISSYSYLSGSKQSGLFFLLKDAWVKKTEAHYRKEIEGGKRICITQNENSFYDASTTYNQDGDQGVTVRADYTDKQAYITVSRDIYDLRGIPEADEHESLQSDFSVMAQDEINDHNDKIKLQDIKTKFKKDIETLSASLRSLKTASPLSEAMGAQYEQYITAQIEALDAQLKTVNNTNKPADALAAIEAFDSGARKNVDEIHRFYRPVTKLDRVNVFSADYNPLGRKSFFELQAVLSKISAALKTDGRAQFNAESIKAVIDSHSKKDPIPSLMLPVVYDVLIPTDGKEYDLSAINAAAQTKGFHIAETKQDLASAAATITHKAQTLAGLGSQLSIPQESRQDVTYMVVLDGMANTEATSELYNTRCDFTEALGNYLNQPSHGFPFTEIKDLTTYNKDNLQSKPGLLKDNDNIDFQSLKFYFDQLSPMMRQCILKATADLDSIQDNVARKRAFSERVGKIFSARQDHQNIFDTEFKDQGGQLKQLVDFVKAQAGTASISKEQAKALSTHLKDTVEKIEQLRAIDPHRYPTRPVTGAIDLVGAQFPSGVIKDLGSVPTPSARNDVGRIVNDIRTQLEAKQEALRDEISELNRLDLRSAEFLQQIHKIHAADVTFGAGTQSFADLQAGLQAPLIESTSEGVLESLDTLKIPIKERIEALEKSIAGIEKQRKIGIGSSRSRDDRVKNYSNSKNEIGELKELLAKIPESTDMDVAFDLMTPIETQSSDSNWYPTLLRNRIEYLEQNKLLENIDASLEAKTTSKKQPEQVEALSDTGQNMLKSSILSSGINGSNAMVNIDLEIKKSNQFMTLSHAGLLSGNSGLDFVEPLSTIKDDYKTLAESKTQLQNLIAANDLDDTVKENLKRELKQLTNASRNIKEFDLADKAYKQSIEDYKQAFAAAAQADPSKANAENMLAIDQFLHTPDTEDEQAKRPEGTDSTRDLLRIADQVRSKSEIAKSCYVRAVLQGNADDKKLEGNLKGHIDYHLQVSLASITRANHVKDLKGITDFQKAYQQARVLKPFVDPSQNAFEAIEKTLATLKTTRDRFTAASNTISQQLDLASQQTANEISALKLQGVIEGSDQNAMIDAKLEALQNHYADHNDAWASQEGQSEKLDDLIENLKVAGTKQQRPRKTKDVVASRTKIIDMIKGLAGDNLEGFVKTKQDQERDDLDPRDAHQKVLEELKNRFNDGSEPGVITEDAQKTYYKNARLALLADCEGNFSRLEASLFCPDDLKDKTVQNALGTLKKQLHADLKLSIDPIKVSGTKGEMRSKEEIEALQIQITDATTAVGTAIQRFKAQKDAAKRTASILGYSGDANDFGSFLRTQGIIDSDRVSYYTKAYNSLQLLKQKNPDANFAELQSIVASNKDYAALASLAGTPVGKGWVKSSPDFLGSQYDDLRTARHALEISKDQLPHQKPFKRTEENIQMCIDNIDTILGEERPKNILAQALGRESVKDVLKTYKKGKSSAKAYVSDEKKLKEEEAELETHTNSLAEHQKQLIDTNTRLVAELTSALDEFAEDTGTYKTLNDVKEAVESGPDKLLASTITGLLGEDLTKHAWYEAYQARDALLENIDKESKKVTNLTKSLNESEKTLKSKAEENKLHAAVSQKLNDLVKTDFDKLFSTDKGRDILMKNDLSGFNLHRIPNLSGRSSNIALELVKPMNIRDADLRDLLDLSETSGAMKASYAKRLSELSSTQLNNTGPESELSRYQQVPAYLRQQLAKHETLRTAFKETMKDITSTAASSIPQPVDDLVNEFLHNQLTNMLGSEAAEKYMHYYKNDDACKQSIIDAVTQGAGIVDPTLGAGVEGPAQKGMVQASALPASVQTALAKVDKIHDKKAISGTQYMDTDPGTLPDNVHSEIAAIDMRLVDLIQECEKIIEKENEESDMNILFKDKRYESIKEKADALRKQLHKATAGDGDPDKIIKHFNQALQKDLYAPYEDARLQDHNDNVAVIGEHDLYVTLDQLATDFALRDTKLSFKASSLKKSDPTLGDGATRPVQKGMNRTPIDEIDGTIQAIKVAMHSAARKPDVDGTLGYKTDAYQDRVKAIQEEVETYRKQTSGKTPRGAALQRLLGIAKHGRDVQNSFEKLDKLQKVFEGRLTFGKLTAHKLGTTSTLDKDNPQAIEEKIAAIKAVIQNNHSHEDALNKKIDEYLSEFTGRRTARGTALDNLLSIAEHGAPAPSAEAGPEVNPDGSVAPTTDPDAASVAPAPEETIEEKLERLGDKFIARKAGKFTGLSDLNDESISQQIADIKTAIENHPDHKEALDNKIDMYLADSDRYVGPRTPRQKALSALYKIAVNGSAVPLTDAVSELDSDLASERGSDADSDLASERGSELDSVLDDGAAAPKVRVFRKHDQEVHVNLADVNFDNIEDQFTNGASDADRTKIEEAINDLKAVLESLGDDKTLETLADLSAEFQLDRDYGGSAVTTAGTLALIQKAKDGLDRSRGASLN